MNYYLEDWTNIQTHLKYFDKDKAEEWLKNKAPVGRNSRDWSVNERMLLTLWLMTHFGYTEAQMIKDYDFRQQNNKLGNFSRAFKSPTFKKHKDMLIDTFNSKEILIDGNKFRVQTNQIGKKNKEELELVPKFQPSEDILKEKIRVQSVIDNDVSNIVDTLQQNVYSCKVDFVKGLIRGAVYIIYEKLSKKIIYIGSSKHIYRRCMEHNYDCFDETSVNYVKELYEYVRDNQLTKDDIELIPICICAPGFELHLEAAFYDDIKNKKIFHLLNDNRPIKPEYTLDFFTTIYIMNDTRGNIVIYVGTSNKFHKRRTQLRKAGVLHAIKQKLLI